MRKFNGMKLYNIYLKQHIKSSKLVEKHGGYVHDRPYNSLNDFWKDLQVEKNTVRLQGDTKKSLETMAKELARRDVYGISKEQIKAQAKAIWNYNLEKKGESDTLKNIADKLRYGEEYKEFWDSIKNTRKKLKRENYSNEDIDIYIGQEYFGSN